MFWETWRLPWEPCPSDGRKGFQVSAGQLGGPESRVLALHQVRRGEGQGWWLAKTWGTGVEAL